VGTLLIPVCPLLFVVVLSFDSWLLFFFLSTGQFSVDVEGKDRGNKSQRQNEDDNGINTEAGRVIRVDTHHSCRAGTRTTGILGPGGGCASPIRSKVKRTRCEKEEWNVRSIWGVSIDTESKEYYLTAAERGEAPAGLGEGAESD